MLGLRSFIWSGFVVFVYAPASPRGAIFRIRFLNWPNRNDFIVFDFEFVTWGKIHALDPVFRHNDHVGAAE